MPLPKLSRPASRSSFPSTAAVDEIAAFARARATRMASNGARAVNSLGHGVQHRDVRPTPCHAAWQGNLRDHMRRRARVWRCSILARAGDHAVPRDDGFAKCSRYRASAVEGMASHPVARIPPRPSCGGQHAVGRRSDGGDHLRPYLRSAADDPARRAQPRRRGACQGPGQHRPTDRFRMGGDRVLPLPTDQGQDRLRPARFRSGPAGRGADSRKARDCASDR